MSDDAERAGRVFAGKVFNDEEAKDLIKPGTGVSLNDFLQRHKAGSEQVPSHILETYIFYAGKDRTWVPTEQETATLLSSIMIHESSQKRGGYILEMPIEKEDEPTITIRFVVVKEAFFTVH